MGGTLRRAQRSEDVGGFRDSTRSRAGVDSGRESRTTLASGAYEGQGNVPDSPRPKSLRSALPTRFPRSGAEAAGDGDGDGDGD